MRARMARPLRLPSLYANEVLKCHSKKTVTFTAFDFLKYWVKPYLENPNDFKKYKKTIQFFEMNKQQILKNGMEEVQQQIKALERKKKEMEKLRRFCKAAATAFL